MPKKYSNIVVLIAAFLMLSSHAPAATSTPKTDEFESSVPAPGSPTRPDDQPLREPEPSKSAMDILKEKVGRREQERRREAGSIKGEQTENLNRLLAAADQACDNFRDKGSRIRRSAQTRQKARRAVNAVLEAARQLRGVSGVPANLLIEGGPDRYGTYQVLRAVHECIRRAGYAVQDLAHLSDVDWRVCGSCLRPARERFRSSCGHMKCRRCKGQKSCSACGYSKGTVPLDDWLAVDPDDNDF